MSATLNPLCSLLIESDPGACGDKGLAGGIGLEFLEVLDEHGGQLLSLLVPFAGVGVGVARVENLGIDAGQLGGDLEVEVGQRLGGSLVDVAVEDVVDDAAGVADGDSLAGAVPAGTWWDGG